MNRTDIFDVTIDYSEFYDIELYYSNYFDFELTDDYINDNELTYLAPLCVGCNEAIRSLTSVNAFLLTINGNYLEIKNGGLLMFH